MKRVFAVAAVLALAGCAPATPAPTASEDTLSGSITVFAAASLTDSFEQLKTEFVTAHPDVTITFNFGGSSALAEQIVQGAPVDVFAAASPATMATVVDASLAAEPVDFASNTLELAVPTDNPAGVTALADLENADLAVAFCAPEVPCGAATQTVLDATGLTITPDTYEQDVKAVLTKVELGEVDAGLVYRTDVLAAGDAVLGIEFPEATEAVNRYPIATLSESPNAEVAEAFVAWVLSPEGQKLLQTWGFGAP